MPLVSLLLVASPALMLAPPTAVSAHRLAQPVMQFGAQGGQTPFAPLGTAGGASSAAASGSSALGQSEVADTGEVVKKGKKRKVDPNTGMLDQDRHLPDSSGVSHVPVPSPYHVFEPRMARRSPSAAPCSTRVHDGCIMLADCTVRCNLGMDRGGAHDASCTRISTALALPRRSPPEATATPPVRHQPPRLPRSQLPQAPSRPDLALSRSPTRPPPPLPKGVAATWGRLHGREVATFTWAAPWPPHARLEPPTPTLSPSPGPNPTAL